ncbi:hypothetical protein GEMRC1_013471 [Eukaryota sp. GEM-RC1]
MEDDFLEAYFTAKNFLITYGCTDAAKALQREAGIEINIDEIQECILFMNYFRALELISESFKDSDEILQIKHSISLLGLSDAIASNDNNLAASIFTYNIGLVKQRPDITEDLLAQALVVYLRSSVQFKSRVDQQM